MKLWEVMDLIEKVKDIEQTIETLEYERNNISNKHREKRDMLSEKIVELQHERHSLHNIEVGIISE